MALKTTATWAASQSAGSSGGLVNLIGIVYQAATTAADLRCWRTIPKNIYAARINTPESGMVQIRAGNDHLLGQLGVVSDAFNLVVVDSVLEVPPQFYHLHFVHPLIEPRSHAQFPPIPLRLSSVPSGPSSTDASAGHALATPLLTARAAILDDCHRA